MTDFIVGILWIVGSLCITAGVCDTLAMWVLA